MPVVFLCVCRFTAYVYRVTATGLEPTGTVWLNG